MATETTPRHPGLSNGPIYLDYNATTPVDPRVVEAALPYLTEHFGNPSSTHHYGQAARQAIGQARGEVADLLGAHPDEIVFTAGGSDSDTLAIRGAARANRDRGDHVITQATEHPAVLEACRSLQADGFRLTILPVNHHGRLDPADLEQAITSDTTLVSIMLANAETGTLQPITQLARIAHAHGALFHTDAAQAAGKIPIAMTELGVDLLTVVGHKMYAPKGVGALYVRSGTRLQPTIHGGSQEHGLHAGTENVALIVALGAASRIAADSLPQSASQLTDLRNQLHQRLTDLLPHRVSLNGHPEHRLPGTLNIRGPRRLPDARNDAIQTVLMGDLMEGYGFTSPLRVHFHSSPTKNQRAGNTRVTGVVQPDVGNRGLVRRQSRREPVLQATVSVRGSRATPIRKASPMKRTLLCGLGVAASTMTVMALTAVPATAADTTTTFALAGGALSVSAPATAALTNGNSGATSVSGSLGNTVVTDNRGGTAGWSASAATTAFSNGTTNDTGVSYNSGVPTSTGVVVATSTGATALTAVLAAVVNGTVVVGNNTATWNPTLTVSLPASSTAGDYSGTITTSVL